MLVLSRRLNEKIVFPTVGVTVEILRISGGAVRVGVQAPAHLSVLRHEVLDRSPGFAAPNAPASPNLRGLDHGGRNRLNSALLRLHLLNRQLDAGASVDVQDAIQKALGELESLDRQAAASGRQALGRFQALLVEDDANECELLAGYLRISGFEVATASDGAHALDYLSSHRCPDIVLLDMLMPRCDGAATVNAIRRNSNYDGMKIFAVSGTSPGALGIATGAGGIDRWFEKPINPEGLVQEMNREISRTHCAA